jgi:hypothetical protein
MDAQSESIQLAALLKVKKEKDAPTISPRKSAIHKEDDLDDFLIRGGEYCNIKEATVTFQTFPSVG